MASSSRIWKQCFLFSEPSHSNSATFNPPNRTANDPASKSPWQPFEGRLEYNWVHHYYVKLEASAEQINTGLDLWQASILKEKAANPTRVPWKLADEVHQTLDQIKSGHAPWRTHKFRYTGPRSENPPQWMLVEYDLNFRDILKVVEEQLSSSEFDGVIDYSTYEEFTPNGERVYTNIMSGEWACQQADKIAEDRATHGSMFVPLLSGSDKTTVSVATGHQEYHPFCTSLGNITNTARRAQRNGVVPVAFLPIPKATKAQRKKDVYQRFCQQLYHACLEFIFRPLRQYMSSPKTVKCPDGQYQRAIFGLVPYIADYPEQVYLSGVVSGWCPKCDAPPDNLDEPNSRFCTHEKTDYLLSKFDPGILWDSFGICSDVISFTYFYPCADIHKLLTPDLLHQLIKGVFKDHLVTWVGEYLHHRIASVPAFPGLRRFPDGQDFNQWTDDSKALMKVYLAAIAGHVPSKVVQCISAFIDASTDIQRLKLSIDKFHELRSAFIELGVRASILLPRQHALSHYVLSIILFGAPNGYCSLITESKHIRAVKETWRQSSRFKALLQMLKILLRLEKMDALRQRLTNLGLLRGSTSSFVLRANHLPLEDSKVHSNILEEETTNPEDDAENDDGGPANISPDESLFEVKLAKRNSAYTKLPELPYALWRFLYYLQHDDVDRLPDLHECPLFDGRIHVRHSAMATFYAPSDLCGTANPSYHGHSQYDTVFVVTDGSKEGIDGLEVARVKLFFAFEYKGKVFEFALINWYRNLDTGMWMAELETDNKGRPTFEVIEVESMVNCKIAEKKIC
ncbi:hypothetical protein CPB83DRAFT_870277 [Crepidotus variabilis]|uniref:Uncharacterized protein n=1 Tax=Crepidotus variabilis TaxID=179855 RepID=A0A9P6ECV7_9AGAR|nr:hypothetical protein CPB83DRAFT_870277 [Crepidotus variabilis]